MHGGFLPCAYDSGRTSGTLFATNQRTCAVCLLPTPLRKHLYLQPATTYTQLSCSPHAVGTPLQILAVKLFKLLTITEVFPDWQALKVEQARGGRCVLLRRPRQRRRRRR